MEGLPGRRARKRLTGVSLIDSLLTIAGRVDVVDGRPDHLGTLHDCCCGTMYSVYVAFQGNGESLGQVVGELVEALVIS